MTFQQSNPGQSTVQTASAQEPTEGSAVGEQREAAYLNYRRIEKMGVENAQTIMARDYKGFGTGHETQNGVIEWRKEKK